MRAENGPSLCLGCQLCWSFELQIFSSFPGMAILLTFHISYIPHMLDKLGFGTL